MRFCLATKENPLSILTLLSVLTHHNYSACTAAKQESTRFSNAKGNGSKGLLIEIMEFIIIHATKMTENIKTNHKLPPNSAAKSAIL